MLQSVVDRLRAALAADVTLILLLREGGDTLDVAAFSLSEAGHASGPVERFGLPWSTTGVTGAVVRTGQLALVADTRLHPRAARHIGTEVPESVLAAPLTVRGTTIGVLRASVLQAGRFGEADLRLMEILARQTAVIVENVRLYETTREQKDRLALYARLVAASPEAITLVGPDGAIQHCNPAAERLYGYTAQELVGKHARVLYSAENPTELVNEIRDAIQTTGEWHGEVLHRRKDGSDFYAEVHRSAVQDDAGQALGSVGIVRDLTRRKEVEAHLVQTEKLRSLGVLASGVAHQMNNTLASILGQAELLLATNPAATFHSELHAIIQAAEDGAAAVRRIQDFARVAPPHSFAPLDLVAISQDVAAATAPRWRDRAEREGRAISLTISEDGPVHVSGLGAELREALTNVVLNAVDALPDGGNIRISVGRERDEAVLTVQDDGTGMPADVLQRALDPFFTTKPFGAGSGLGLALTHGIVQRHGGTVDIRSRPGRGTTVEFRLPAIPAPAAASAPADAPVPGALRVLVVDDEVMLGGQLRVILNMDGHQVRVCQRGAEAIAALASEPFDLVITDLGMPGVNGWDVAREAKARHPSVRVGLITGWAGELNDAAELARGGVDFVIAKPYRIQTIRDAVSKVAAG